LTNKQPDLLVCNYLISYAYHSKTDEVMNHMILANKIIKLRKQFGWSQEELAEKMDISRQSVSKWESTNSIPDLKKIIMLADIFDVTTDFLLKDDVEVCDSISEGIEPAISQITLEQSLNYVENKMKVADLVTKGVVLCICSVIPLFFFWAMAKINRLDLTSDVVAAIGVVSILIIISIGISFFIRTNQYKNDIAQIENEAFELAYGVHSVFKEKLEKFRTTYNIRLSLGIFISIMSFVPLMFGSIFSGGAGIVLMMLIVLILMIATGIYIIATVSAKYNAYNSILKESCIETKKTRRTKRAEKLAAFYWPLLTAAYLGWSLWTMDWGVTWIVWPVGAVFFAALFGLMELLDKEDY
jgi:transcriptional regulator with XRE-family HTH domain